MQDLYKQMYLKYAPNLSEEEVNAKVAYANTLDKDTFMNSFYQKYTGQGPSQDQKQYAQQYAKDGGLEWGEAKDAVTLGLKRIAVGTAGLIEQTVGAGKDLIDQTEKWWESVDISEGDLGSFEKLTAEEKIANRANIEAEGLQLGFGRLRTSTEIQKEIDTIQQRQTVYDNSILDDFKAGRIGQAFERTALGGLSSWTSYTAMLHPGALAVLGVTHAGEKWDKNFAENPDETNALMFLNAAGTGAIEYGGDMIARRFLLSPNVRAFVGGSKSPSARQAVIDMGLGVAGRIVTAMGIEGGTEMAQALAVDIWDSFDKLYGTDIRIGLGKDEELKKLGGAKGVLSMGMLAGDRKKWHQIYDEGIIGAFMGGNVRVAGEGFNAVLNNNAQEKRAEVLLRSTEDKKYIADNFSRIQVLQKELEQTEDVEIQQTLRDEMKQLENNIVMRQTQSSKVVRQMKGIDLFNYASNIDKINKFNEKLNRDNITPEAKALYEKRKNEAQQANDLIYKDHVSKSLNKNLNTSQAYADAAGIEQKVMESADDYQKAYENSEAGKKQFSTDGYYDNVTGSDGFFDGQGRWYINKEQALKTEAISVGSHELLHGVLKSTLRGADGVMTKQGQKLVQDFVDTLTTSQRRYVQRRIDANYRFDAQGNELDFKDYGEEYLNIFSDGIMKREIKYDEGALTKMANIFQGKFLDTGINKNFRSGEDVYDFMKTYNRRIRTGKIDQTLVDMLREGSQRAGVTAQSRSGDLRIDIDSMVDTNQTKESFQNNFPLELSEVFSNQSDMLDGLILEGIGGNNIYGKSKEQFLDDVKGELMIRSYKQFDPTKNESFFGWLTGKNRSGKTIIELSKGDVSNKYQKDKMASLDRNIEGKEGSEMSVQIEDTSMNPEEAMIAKEDEQQYQIEASEQLLTKELGIEKGSDLYNEIILANEAALSGEISFEDLRKQLTPMFVNKLTDKLTEIMGKGKKYEAFIDKYGQAVFSKLPIKELVALERLVPESDRIFTKVVKKNMNPNEIRAHEKKFGHTEALYYESETQGPTLYEKLNPSVDQIKSFLLVPIKNPTTGKRSGLRGNRKTKVASLAATELGFDGTIKVIKDTNSSRNSNILQNNKDWLKPKIVEVGRQISRNPDIQFSISTAQMLQGDIVENGFFSIFNSKFELKNKALKEKYGMVVDQLMDEMIDTYEALVPAKTRMTIESIYKTVKGGRGIAAEQVYYDTVSGHKVKGVSVEGEVTEAGGAADLQVIIHNKNANTEIKLNENAQFSSINVSKFDFVTGEYELVKKDLPKKYQKLFDDQIKKAKKAYTNYINKANELIVEYNQANGTNFGLVKTNKDFIPEPVWKKLGSSGENLAIQIMNDSLTETNADIIKYLYNNKPGEGNKVFLIEILEKGLFGLNNTKIAPGLIPELDATVELRFRIKSSGSVIKNGVKGYKPELAIIPVIKTINNSSNLSMLRQKDLQKIAKASFSKSHNDALANNNRISFSKSTTLEQSIRKLKNMDKALKMSRRKNPPVKGISIIDFDDTLATSNSMVIVNMPDGKTSKITPAEFATQATKLEQQGAKFDFSEFNDVKEGKIGPFFNKAKSLKEKFGNTDIFVLTARPPAAAPAIQKFLKSVGLDLKIENITGLADGRPEAKAEFIVEKAAMGYNNFLFADDAIKNVKAVETALDILDVKGKVYQARAQFSNSLNQNFNFILEESQGVDPNETVSAAAARVQGSVKNKFEFFIPPSAEDFVGLLYRFAGEGKQGEIHMQFLENALVKPFAKAYRLLNHAKQAIATDFKALKELMPDTYKNLTVDSGYKNFTYGDAVRVYLWNRSGHEIPGMSDTDVDALVDIVEEFSDLTQFANELQAITRLDSYPEPEQGWTAGNVASDLYYVSQRVNRQEYLQEWIENKNEIFNPDNMNKIEALYGSHFREALEDMLFRMETGTNRKFGQNRQVNQWLNWVNNSVGAIMFINIRSAMLQTISFANFINWGDNNPLAAAEAFANQKQFWSDFSMIFNSDTLKQRRAGLQTDVNEAELANAVARGKGSVNSAISYILKKGFLPTQMADSFAISFGGASLYRNRLNTYLDQGMDQEAAKEKAFGDFLEVSEKTQQSARPDLISQQQAGPLGRLILAFQNTPMQYMRLSKKAISDLKNGRGDVKTNISKIIYYTTVQNIIFSGLQSALFMMMGFSDDEEAIEDKKIRALNTSLDTILRGSGIAGATVSTFKNMILSFRKESEKGGRADYARTMIEAANISPPIGSKLRKLYNSFISYKYNKDEIEQMGFHIDNPGILGVANFISATTNIPLDRAIMITNNLRASSDSNNATWQRVATLLGWNTWDVGIERKKIKVKKTRKKTRKKKSR